MVAVLPHGCSKCWGLVFLLPPGPSFRVVVDPLDFWATLLCWGERVCFVSFYSAFISTQCASKIRSLRTMAMFSCHSSDFSMPRWETESYPGYSHLLQAQNTWRAQKHMVHFCCRVKRLLWAPAAFRPHRSEVSCGDRAAPEEPFSAQPREEGAFSWI